jgi:hypothetical protein
MVSYVAEDSVAYHVPFLAVSHEILSESREVIERKHV